MSSHNWHQPLIDWFTANCRTLPWRDEPTPYRVLVSEFMLQQTQVATVIPYFNRFMAAFPTLDALADAGVDDVVKLWEGLGYYSRARHLHQCAREIQRLGAFPDNPDELSILPGIGGYTAAAIASIAFGKRVPVVDGNVLRIRARMTADDSIIDSDMARKRHYAELQSIMPEIDNPSFFNQAMMELGALVCHPQKPDCVHCPVQNSCKAHELGTELDYPRRKEKAPVPHYHVAVALIYDQERFLILKRSDEQMLGGLWEFPGGKLEKGETPAQAAVREVREETALDVTVIKEVTVVRHAYSHFKITMHAFACRLVDNAQQIQTDRPFHWIRFNEKDNYAFPKANHKIFEAMQKSLKKTLKCSKKL